MKGYGNGNIATMYWEVAGRDRQAYAYKYDDLDRLKHAYYAEIDYQDKYYNHGNYDAWGFVYDKVGNIEQLSRNGPIGTCTVGGQLLQQFGKIDDLHYTYNADRTHLMNVTDNVLGDPGKKGFRNPGGDYEYDYNGNVKRDVNKGLDIQYNHLNLPGVVGGSIVWVYDATGRKLKKTGSTTIWYHDGIEKHDNGDWYVYTPEGRVASYTPDPEAVPSKPRKWQYEYNLRDHLGNTRLTVADDNGDGYIQVTGNDWSAGPLATDYTEVLQENHYYPFGMNMDGFWREPGVPAKMNAYQYNGKELVYDLGLGWNDYGARWYDAAIGRWNAVDPMAEGYLNSSGYSYTLNNPIRNLDPNGMYSSPFQRNEAEQFMMNSEKERDNQKMVGDFYFDEYGNFMRFQAAERTTVYVRDQCTETVIGVPESNFVSFTEKAFKKFVAVTVGETDAVGSQEDMFSEAQGIGDVILNRLDTKGGVLNDDFINKVGGKKQYNAIDAVEKDPTTGERKPGAYSVIMGKSIMGIIELSTTYAPRIRGAISALSPANRGSSSGAYFFNKTDQNTWDDIGDNWKAYNDGTFSITTTIGGTTFFKYSDSSNKKWP